MIRTIGMIAIGVVCLAQGAVAATIVDFDDPLGPNASIGGTVTIAAIGAGACSNFSIGTSSASGNALCGRNLDTGGFNDGLTMTGIDFDAVSSITFSFASNTTSEFEPADGLFITGNGTELARFEGSTVNNQVMVSALFGTTDANGAFQDFTISGVALTATGVGDLVFDMRTTANSEFIALDSVTVEVSSVPLPAPALLLLGGLGAIGALRRRRGESAPADV